jgi:hypothetical protein
MSNEKSKASAHSKYVVPRKRINTQMVQNVLLMWLDNNIDDNSDDCRNTITHLRPVVNTINTFTDVDQCVDSLTNIDSENVCMIISDTLGQYIVPLIHDVAQLHTIVIYCKNKVPHEQWIKDCSKIKGVFTEVSPICEALKQASQECEQNAIPISFMTTNDIAFKKNLDQLDSSFMYTQILKEILLAIEFDQNHKRIYQPLSSHVRWESKSIEKC